MLKIILYAVKSLSIFILAVISLWLLFLTMFLLETGGRYSITTESGVTMCGIWFFAEHGFLWTMFELYGVPLMIIAASWRTIAFCSEKIKLTF